MKENAPALKSRGYHSRFSIHHQKRPLKVLRTTIKKPLAHAADHLHHRRPYQ